MRRYLLFLFICFGSVLLLTDCRKDKLLIDPSAKLELESDTLSFDTVFTDVGSTTLWFKIYNRHKKSLKVDRIMLEDGLESSFRINVDGASGIVFEDQIIAPEDSMYIFVEVTVDPDNKTAPFIIADRILFETNGNAQHVTLTAYGWNAVYYNGDTIPDCNAVWTKDKPIVIVRYAMVAPDCYLTIEAGTQVYLHGNASLFVLGGLHVDGIKGEEVVFNSDRLESFYENLPGQWQAIHLLRGSGQKTGEPNWINYAIIKNALIGITSGQFILEEGEEPVIEFDAIPTYITNTVIENIQQTALFFFFANVQVYNTVVFNAGANLLQCVLGGLYGFEHCTFVNYGTDYLEHKNAAVQLGNNAEGIGEVELIANFTNTIIYGGLEDELEYSDDPAADFTVSFNNCAVKSKTTDTTFYNKVLVNEDPEFKLVSENDFHLLPISPCINIGDSADLNSPYKEDIDGILRDEFPDLGAYEYVQ